MEDSAFWALKQPLKEDNLMPNNISSSSSSNNIVCNKKNIFITKYLDSFKLKNFDNSLNHGDMKVKFPLTEFWVEVQHKNRDLTASWRPIYAIVFFWPLLNVGCFYWNKDKEYIK